LISEAIVFQVIFYFGFYKLKKKLKKNKNIYLILKF
jgi:hypothetical protein